ncbi:hypothetical protein F4553_005323 [Allocatelliglobosispora scoriae]|uniref:Uncharacterized protein n=1 Tax=Allocatelliglobosispora scoriae TaxID=643052 RepID=A0A841BUR7_9ACTN|nr:hypothetical protein [Allocatelliglobosispora scoriae]MBB5871944.1 hypothetical protein [Allocatelliglobosispora scoriae]
MIDGPSLAALVVGYPAGQPEQAARLRRSPETSAPASTADMVSVGAVITTCPHLAAEGRLVQANPAPMTFALSARTDDAGQQ